MQINQFIVNGRLRSSALVEFSMASMPSMSSGSSHTVPRDMYPATTANLSPQVTVTVGGIDGMSVHIFFLD